MEGEMNILLYNREKYYWRRGKILICLINIKGVIIVVNKYIFNFNFDKF